MQRHYQLLAYMALCVWAHPMMADEMDHLFQEYVGPSSDGTLSYVQDWSGVYITERWTDIHEIYVQSEGKLSSFRGILELHCANSANSTWLATGELPSPDTVPPEAIRKIRELYC